MQKAAADILAIAVLNPEEEGFQEKLEELVGRLNKRLWKGFEKTPKEKEGVDENFRKANCSKPKRTLTSFPPNALPDLILFLTSSPHLGCVIYLTHWGIYLVKSKKVYLLDLYL